MLNKAQHAIRVLEVEAEMNEKQAKRFAEFATYVNALEHKRTLEKLSAEALEKAAAIRTRVRKLRSASHN